MSAVILVAAAFVVMEPVASLAHRYVMHGRGYSWHRSHHLPAASGFEPNDRYPVVFAAATIVAMALGTVVRSLQPLVWIGVGVTLYGCAYALVHEICIHGRFVGRPLGRRGYVGYVRAAHRVHHIGGRGPYGFLLPIVTFRDRQRVVAITSRSVDRRDASGRPTAMRATVDSFRDAGTDARPAKTS